MKQQVVAVALGALLSMSTVVRAVPHETTHQQETDTDAQDDHTRNIFDESDDDFLNLDAFEISDPEPEPSELGLFLRKIGFEFLMKLFAIQDFISDTWDQTRRRFFE